MAVNALPNYIVPVSLDCIGEKTGSRWTGTFHVKCVITHADRFAIERMYSALMPINPSRQLDDELILRAETISQLSVRIELGPPWWDSTKSGQLLVDSEPLYALLNLCQDATKKWNEDLSSKASLGNSNAVSQDAPKP